MTLAPRWTCSKCGRHERHQTEAGKPFPPPAWRGWQATLLCPECQTPRAAPRSELEQPECGPPGAPHAPVTVRYLPGFEPKPEKPAKPAPERKTAEQLADQRQRLRAALVADPKLANGAIAKAVGCDTDTVRRHRRLLEAEGVIPVIRRRGRGEAKAA